MLQFLDVRNNQSPTLDAALLSLRKCHELRHVWLDKVTRENLGTVSSWRDRVFLNLPGLLSCDGGANPLPFSPAQWAGVRVLKVRMPSSPSVPLTSAGNV